MYRSNKESFLYSISDCGAVNFSQSPMRAACLGQLTLPLDVFIITIS
jgi:hypothetical protein